MKNKVIKSQLLSTIFILIILLFNSNSCFAQWVVIGNINTTQLNSVKFFDQNMGITVGVGGIWRTTDGGINWTHVLTSVNLNSVSFPDIYNGMAVGDSGRMFKTTDNGLNWVPLTSGVQNNLYGISFPTTYVGYAVGQNGLILKTINSGLNWQTQITVGYDFNCVRMKDATTGYACGGSGREFVLSTANGGYNWIGNAYNQGPSLRSIDAVGLSLVVAVGDNGRIRKSTNNGAYWTFPSSNTTLQLNSVFLTNPFIMYICGNSGKILISTNGGDNWTTQTANTQSNLNCLSFINSYTGWAVGQNGIVLNIGSQVGVHNITEETPSKFELYQNYPNPFNPSTTIRFDLPEKTHVKITLHDMLGKEVDIIVNKIYEAGSHKVKLEASNLSSGIYFYKIECGKFFQSRKLILIK